MRAGRTRSQGMWEGPGCWCEGEVSGSISKPGSPSRVVASEAAARLHLLWATWVKTWGKTGPRFAWNPRRNLAPGAELGGSALKQNHAEAQQGTMPTLREGQRRRHSPGKRRAKRPQASAPVEAKTRRAGLGRISWSSSELLTLPRKCLLFPSGGEDRREQGS